MIRSQWSQVLVNDRPWDVSPVSNSEFDSDYRSDALPEGILHCQAIPLLNKFRSESPFQAGLKYFSYLHAQRVGPGPPHWPPNAPV